MTELFLMLVVRTYKPFYQSRPGRYLLLSTLLVTVITLWLPYSPLSAPIGFVPLPLNVLGLVFLITALYLLIAEFAKRMFYRRFRL